MLCPVCYTIFRLFSVDYSIISPFWNPKTSIFMVYDCKNIESVAFTFAFDHDAEKLVLFVTYAFEPFKFSKDIGKLIAECLVRPRIAFDHNITLQQPTYYIVLLGVAR